MANLKVEVQDGNNLTVEVVPQVDQTIVIDRGISSPGVSQIIAGTNVTIDPVGGTGAVTINATSSGTVTSVTATAPVVSSGGIAPNISLPAATTSVNGYLTSTDWTTFNNKVSAVTSTDGSVIVTGTTTSDLSVNTAKTVITEVRNATGATLTKGTAVYITGAIGQLPTVSKAQANSDATSAQTLGLMTTDLANNSNGYVTLIGLLTNLNTSSYTDGQQLYLSPTVAGGLTATKPVAPQHLVYVAVVEHAHITQGKLFVKVQNGYELDELHDVSITSPVNGQSLVFDSATSLWKNQTITAGISGSGTTNYVTKFTGTTAVGNSIIYDNGTNVGIGTSSPNAKLDVNGHVKVGDLYSYCWGDYSTSINGSSADDFISFYTTAAERMRIDSSGNVGIGTSSPSTKLDVNGGITGTTITATDLVGGSPPSFVINDGANSGVDCTFGIDQTTLYPYITATDGLYNYPLQLNDGVSFPAGVNLNVGQGNALQLASGVSTGSTTSLYSNNSSYTPYSLYLPSSAGSNNQVLKTDGSGNLSWTSTLSGFEMAVTSDPSAPSINLVETYGRSYGGYQTLAARNALNKPFGLQSALWSKSIQMWTSTNSTNGSFLGNLGTGSGTFTAVSPTAGSTLYQTIRRSTYANVITTTNQLLGVTANYGACFRGSVAGQGGFFYYARCGFDVWTNGGRFFAGAATSSAVVNSGDPSALNNTVGFCVDAADNGAISFLTRGTAATKASTGYTITSNKGYDLYIYCAPNSSQYTWEIVDINAGTSATGTATANLPTNTTIGSPFVVASNAALTPATSISLGVAKIYVETDY